MRWAIMGHGDVVERRVTAAIRAGGHEIASVWGRDAARVEAFGRRHAIGKTTTSVDEAIEDAEAVYVATPVASHVPLALAAVRAGRHVLIEKPLAAGTHGTRELVEASRGLRAGVAYYRRLWPGPRHLRLLLRFAKEPVHFNVRFRCAFDPAPGDPMYWRTRSAVAGAGVLADAGSHRIDLLTWMLGAPVAVRAHLSGFFDGGCERLAEVALQWQNGSTADCRFAWSDGPAEDRFECTTAGRKVSLDLAAGGPSSNTHIPLIDDFTEAVRTGRDPVCPLNDALVTDDVIVATLAQDDGRQRAKPQLMRSS